MPNGMLSLDEVTQYLDIDKTVIEELVKRDKLNAYKIGGIYLRFRKDQVVTLKRKVMRKKKKEKESNTLEHVRDFWEFNNFYIIASVCLLVLLYFTLR